MKICTFHVGLSSLIEPIAESQVWPSQPFTSSRVTRTAETFWEQLTSPAYRACLMWYSALLLGTQFSIASVNDQMRLKADAASTEYLIIAFQSAMGATGFGAPLSGFLIDSVGFARVAVAITLGLAGWYLCLLSPSIAVQYVGFGLHGISRVSLFAFFFSYVSGTFGFRNYGKLAGVGLLLSGIFSLGLYPLLHMSLQGFAHESFTYANLVHLALAAVSGIFPLRLFREEQANLAADKRNHGASPDQRDVPTEASESVVAVREIISL